MTDRQPGDKTGNDLAWEAGHGRLEPYMLQLMPISPSQALAIVGFRRAHMSQPSDMIQDLVAVDVQGKPRLDYLRSIGVPLDLEETLSFPRLYRSQKQLLLRVDDGFESLTLQGKSNAKLSVPYALKMIGSAGKELVFGSYHSADLAVNFFDLNTRKQSRLELPKPPGQVTSVFYSKWTPGHVRVRMSLNLTSENAGSATYDIDLKKHTVSPPILEK